jgi:hypothetical protein
MADAGGQVLLAIRRNCIQNRNGHDRNAGKLYCGKLVSPQKSVDEMRQIGLSGMVLKNLIQYDLERPGLQ